MSQEDGEAKCLITGADLVDTARNSNIHGDLFVFDGMFIFNAGKCRWAYGTTLGVGAKFVLATSFFERNGVLVFRAHPSLLSPAARAYIGGEWS